MAEEQKSLKKKLIGTHIVYVALIFIICCIQGTVLFFNDEANKRQAETVIVLKKQLNPFLKKEERLRNMQLTLLVNYRISEYEAKYYSIIYDDFSVQYGTPWEIYPTLMRIESNFNPTARSEKGAQGLTQVMPATGREVAKSLGIKFDINVTLWNDIHNMVIGFTYLSREIVAGGLEHGVKVYLGGPGYSKTEKRKGDMYAYIGSYRTSVKEEFDRNQFIYMGVSSNIFSIGMDSLRTKSFPEKVDSEFTNNNPLYPDAPKDDKKE